MWGSIFIKRLSGLEVRGPPCKAIKVVAIVGGFGDIDDGMVVVERKRRRESVVVVYYKGLSY